MGLETWPAKLVRDPELANHLRRSSLDVLLNVHSLYVIHKDILLTPRFGAFNLHPGPLPRYAGLGAVSWAIYRGEKTHGVTVHKMEPEIDAGPIVYQSVFPITEQDTAFSLSFKCMREGLHLVIKLLEALSADPGNIPLLSQDLSKREYFGPGTPENGCLSWSWSAERIVNFVRACDYFPFSSPWGHPQSWLGEQKVAVAKAERTGLPCNITRGTVGQRDGSGVLVAAVDEWVSVSKIKIGEGYINAEEVLKPGDCLSETRTSSAKPWNASQQSARSSVAAYFRSPSPL
jgi:methionyl-tRNA formyltransferase